MMKLLINGGVRDRPENQDNQPEDETIVPFATNRGEVYYSQRPNLQVYKAYELP